MGAARGAYLAFAARRVREDAPLLGGRELSMQREHVPALGAIGPMKLRAEPADLGDAGKEYEHGAAAAAAAAAALVLLLLLCRLALVHVAEEARHQVGGRAAADNPLHRMARALAVPAARGLASAPVPDPFVVIHLRVSLLLREHLPPLRHVSARLDRVFHKVLGHRVRAPGYAQHLAPAEVAREEVRVERRAHQHHLEVRVGLERVTQHDEQIVRIERALVDLVDHHVAHLPCMATR